MLYPNLQPELFRYKLKDSGCSIHQAVLLLEEKLLSFNPKTKKEFEGYEIRELKFLKNLYFDSGIPANIVKAMLSKLKRPYSFSFNNIYWDYGTQEWKVIPPNVDEYINENLTEIIIENFDEFLENIDDDNEDDMENLTHIKTAINKRLKKN